MTRVALPTRADFPVRRPMPTRWADDDAYGHANNVVYYAWFDTTVNGWLMDATGADVRRLPAIGVVAETSCRYLAPVGFPDQLEIGLGVDRVGGRSVTYRLAVFRTGEELPSALGRFVHVYVDAATRRPVPVPEVIRAAVASLT
jgi:acyl-CoA thioester hydrolase